ncbi:MAG: ABC transporter permease [Anaerolineae bacterium]|nr:ABC transporter permease [Anaerolineae bacterium]
MKTIHDTLAITWKETLIILKDRGSLMIFLLLPLLLGVMMGGANMASRSVAEGEILVEVNLVNQDAGDMATEVVRAIKSISQLDVSLSSSVVDAEAQVRAGEVAAAIIIPEDFSASIDAHELTSVDVVVDPGQPEAASIVAGIMNHVVDEVTIWGEVQYGVRTLLDESGLLSGASIEQQRAVTAQTMGVIMTALGDLRRAPVVDVAVEDLEGAVLSPGWEAFFALLFPGFTVMFIFMNVSWAASSLLTEREAGTFRRLLAAPIPRGALIAGKMLAFMLLSCVQVVLLFSVAAIFFGMPLGQSPAGLVLLTLAVAVTSAGLGMLIAALARSSQQAGTLGVILGLVLAAIGGCMPMASQPLPRVEGFVGTLSRLTPQGHALNGYYTLLAENGTLAQVLPEIGILLAISLVLFIIATWRFKFD